MLKRSNVERADDMRRLAARVMSDSVTWTSLRTFKKQRLVVRGATIHNLINIGTAAAGITKAFRAKHPDVPWRDVDAMRGFWGKPDRMLDFNAVWRGIKQTVPAILVAPSEPPRRERRGEVVKRRSATATSGPPTRLPPPTWNHVVLVHQIARALGWSSARVRSVDDLLKPFRLADGARVYDLERAVAFIQIIDTTEEYFADFNRLERARERALRRWCQRRGVKVPI